jgi:hypothetical protein
LKVDLPGLLAAWSFDEPTGYSFADVTGHGHDLFITGTNWNTTDSGLAGAIHRKGQRGGAVYLDGARWLEADLAPDLASLSDVTLTCRVRPDRMPSTVAVLIGHAPGYALDLQSDGAVVLRIADAGGRVHVLRTSKGVVVPGRWTFLAATVSPRTRLVRLYVDGIPRGQARWQPFTLHTTPTHLVVGRGLTGAIDEMAIYGTSLDLAAVRRSYVVGLPRVYTQTSETIDPERKLSTHFHGSEPIPHPATPTSVLTLRFDDSARSEEGHLPIGEGPDPADPGAFVPGAFGGAWRAMSQRLSYASSLRGSSGTFEAWYATVPDARDPRRLRRKEVFTAVGRSGLLVAYTQDGRWCVQVRRSADPVQTLAAQPQAFVPGTLEHLAVTWGRQADGSTGVALYVNGTPAGFLALGAEETAYDERFGLGGNRNAPAFCLLQDVRISGAALTWGEICSRGHAVSGVAGLDLRDRFDRPPTSSPLLWRPASTGAAWSHRRQTWQRPDAVGDDPDSVRALFQGAPVGLHPAYHPDAYGHASSIEAGVALDERVDGWAGLFVHSPVVGSQFTGATFMLNPRLSVLRLARFQDGLIVDQKVLPHDFPMSARTTYEMTLTCAGDGVVRGFVDGSNLISMRSGPAWPDRGYAGMLTENARAFFDDLHFCALTPATPASRVVRIRTHHYAAGAGVAAVELTPFRWQKRRGLLPWQYTRQLPEPAGNIAGAATKVPPRPIRSAAWRSEDSANSDLVVVNGRMYYFMRGNPRVDNRPDVARVGVLHADVPAYDGVHFDDPNAVTGNLTGGTIIGAPVGGPRRQLNAPSTAYVGQRRLLFLGRESGAAAADADEPAYAAVVFSRYDVTANAWEDEEPRRMAWSDPGQSDVGSAAVLRGSPEVVSLRDPDSDEYAVVVFQQTGGPGQAVMATALLTDVAGGVPTLVAGPPIHTSLARPSGGSIYGFRVLFDNGIYYLHYNEGPQVPDWPERFVLASALDPYAGPWLVSPQTEDADSTYFRRGGAREPDNGAIWQGTMVKHRGNYYVYYENYHSAGDVNDAYAHYANPQVGSRVGYATA